MPQNKYYQTMNNQYDSYTYFEVDEDINSGTIYKLYSAIDFISKGYE